MTERAGNPYNYQDEVKDMEYFVDREEILDKIEYLLGLSTGRRAQYHNIGISGKTGCGKTSLTYAIENVADNMGIETIRIELNNNSNNSEQNVFKRVYEQAADIVGGDVESSFTSLLADSTESVKINLKLVRWHLSSNDSTETEEISEETIKSDLRSIYKEAKETKDIPSFLIILDNAQHISEDKTLLQKLKNVFTGIEGYCLVLSGTEKIFSDIGETHSPISRVIDQFQIGSFESIDETESALRRPLTTEENSDLSQKTVRYVHNITRGRPYEINLIGFFMYYYYTIESNENLILTSDVIEDAASQIESSNINVEGKKISKIKKASSNYLRVLIPVIENASVPREWIIHYALVLLFNTTEPSKVEAQKKRVSKSLDILEDEDFIREINGKLSINLDIYTSAFIKFYSVANNIVKDFPPLIGISGSDIDEKVSYIRNIHYRLFDSLLLEPIEGCHSHFTLPEEFGYQISFREIFIESDNIELDAHSEGPLLSDRIVATQDLSDTFRQSHWQSESNDPEAESEEKDYPSQQTITLRCRFNWMDYGYIVTIHNESKNISEKVRNRLNSLEEDLNEFGIELIYNNEITLSRQAMELYYSEKYDQALQTLDEAEKMNSNYPFIHFHRSFIHYEQQNLDEALTSINRAIEYVDQWTDAIYQKGILHFERNEYEKASDEFQKVVDITPDNRQIYEDICCIMDEHNPSLSIESGEIARRISHDDYHVHYHLAIAYQNAKKYERALEILEEIIENCSIDNRVARAKLNKMSTFDLTERPKKAINIADSIIQNHEDQYAIRNAHGYRGRLYSRLGKHQEALDDLDIFIERANANLDSQDKDIPIDEFISTDETMDTKRQLAASYFYRGVSRIKLNERQSGMEDIGIAIDYEPDYAEQLENMDISLEDDYPSTILDP